MAIFECRVVTGEIKITRMSLHPAGPMFSFKISKFGHRDKSIQWQQKVKKNREDSYPYMRVRGSTHPHSRGRAESTYQGCRLE